MECGHSCESFCHYFITTPEDKTGHNDRDCLKPCSRERTCGDICEYKCYECKRKQRDCLIIKIIKI